MAGAEGRMPKSDIRIGNTYEVSLSQDWTTAVLIVINGEEVILDFEGHLYRYGVPVFRETTTMEHFRNAYWIAPPGDWSREYRHDKYNDHLGYPAG